MMSSTGGVSATGAILVLAALTPTTQPSAQVESLEWLGSIGGPIGAVAVDGDVDSADVVSNSEEMS